MSVDVPRDRTSQTYARLAAVRDAYAAHLAQVRRSSWRLGIRGDYWQLARTGPDTDGWVVLDEQLRVFPDIDPLAERKRVGSWTQEVLGVRLCWFWRDWAALEQGRTAFEVDVKS